jgi:ureidoglycolate lyase
VRTLKIKPLTAEAFRPFGDVIEIGNNQSQPMNRGMAERFDALGRVELQGEQARAVISLVRSSQYPVPHTVDLVERHPLGSQAFIPLEDSPFVVVVAPAGESVTSDALKAFRTNGRQGVNYRSGVWHGLLFTPFAAMTFICVDRAGEGSNCEERSFPPGQQVLLDP